MRFTIFLLACFGATAMAKGYYKRPNHGQAGRGFIVCERAGNGEYNWEDDCELHMMNAPSENCRFCMYKCLHRRETESNRNICEQCTLGGCDVVTCGGKNRIPECVDKWALIANDKRPKMTEVPLKS